MAAVAAHPVRAHQPCSWLSADPARLVVRHVVHLQPIYAWERDARAAHGNPETDRPTSLHLLPQSHGPGGHRHVPGRCRPVPFDWRCDPGAAVCRRLLIYIKRGEEKEMEIRFGQEYLDLQTTNTISDSPLLEAVLASEV